MLRLGNIFVASMRDAHPPARPTKEASTPADLFPEIYKAFLDQEHHRTAMFIEHSYGCIDLRDVIDVKLCVETIRPVELDSHDHGDGGDRHRHGKKSERSFQVSFIHGEPAQFEAHSPEDAKEWAEKLSALKAYWNRRHRVE